MQLLMSLNQHLSFTIRYPRTKDTSVIREQYTAIGGCRFADFVEEIGRDGGLGVCFVHRRAPVYHYQVASGIRSILRLLLLSSLQLYLLSPILSTAVEDCDDEAVLNSAELAHQSFECNHVWAIGANDRRLSIFHHCVT